MKKFDYNKNAFDYNKNQESEWGINPFGPMLVIAFMVCWFFASPYHFCKTLHLPTAWMWERIETKKTAQVFTLSEDHKGILTISCVPVEGGKEISAIDGQGNKVASVVTADKAANSIIYNRRTDSWEPVVFSIHGNGDFVEWRKGRDCYASKVIDTHIGHVLFDGDYLPKIQTEKGSKIQHTLVSYRSRV